MHAGGGGSADAEDIPCQSPSVTYGTNGQEVAKYILVQPQIGPATEGVSGNYDSQKFYVQVWASATTATPITVGRVG